MAFTQEKRPLRVAVAGQDDDALLLERFSGEENVSSPFHFTLDMLSENGSVDPADLLRKQITVTVVIPGGELRHFHGFVSRFSAGGRRAGRVCFATARGRRNFLLSRAYRLGTHAHSH
jgi:type VI secretion system secreted protein VgrG